MKSFLRNSWAVLPIAFLAFGCREAKSPPPVSADQVSSTVESAFKDASPEAKTAAKEIVEAVQGKDDAKAFLELQTLTTRPDLTPEQRSAANRSSVALNEKLRSAAAQGDQKAAEALEVYRAHK